MNLKKFKFVESTENFFKLGLCIVLCGLILITYICIAGAFYKPVTEIRKGDTFSITLPANKTNEIVYLDKDLYFGTPKVGIKINNIQTIDDKELFQPIENIIMEFQAIDLKDLDPSFHTIPFKKITSTDDGFTYIKNFGGYYKIGICLKDNLDTDIKIDFRITGILKDLSK